MGADWIGSRRETFRSFHRVGWTVSTQDRRTRHEMQQLLRFLRRLGHRAASRARSTACDSACHARDEYVVLRCAPCLQWPHGPHTTETQPQSAVLVAARPGLERLRHFAVPRRAAVSASRSNTASTSSSRRWPGCILSAPLRYICRWLWKQAAGMMIAGGIAAACVHCAARGVRWS